MIRGHPGELWWFCHFMELLKNPSEVTKWQKTPISLKWRLIQKNKGLFFSSTLKVEDKKVLLFFCLEVNLMKCRNFDFLPILPFHLYIPKSNYSQESMIVAWIFKLSAHPRVQPETQPVEEQIVKNRTWKEWPERTMSDKSN